MQNKNFSLASIELRSFYSFSVLALDTYPVHVEHMHNKIAFDKLPQLNINEQKIYMRKLYNAHKHMRHIQGKTLHCVILWQLPRLLLPSSASKCIQKLELR